MPQTRGAHARKASAQPKRAGLRGEPRQLNFHSSKSAKTSPSTSKACRRNPRPEKLTRDSQSTRVTKKGKAGSRCRVKGKQKVETFIAGVDGANNEDIQEGNAYGGENKNDEGPLVTTARQQLSHTQSKVHASSVTELQSPLKPFNSHTSSHSLKTRQRQLHHRPQENSQPFSQHSRRSNMQSQQYEVPPQGETQPESSGNLPMLMNQNQGPAPQSPSSVPQNFFTTNDLAASQGFTGDITGDPGYIADQPSHNLDWSAQHTTESPPAAFNTLAAGLADHDLFGDNLPMPPELPFQVPLDNIPSTNPPSSLQVSIPVPSDLWRECPSLSDTNEIHKLEKTMMFYSKLAMTLKNWGQEQLLTISRLHQRLVFEMGRQSANADDNNSNAMPMTYSTMEANRAYSRAVALSIGVNYDQVFNTDMRAGNIAERNNEEERLPVATQTADSGSAVSLAMKAYRIGAEQQSLSARLVSPAQSTPMHGRVVIPSQMFRQQGPANQSEQGQTQPNAVPQVDYGQYVPLTRGEWQQFNSWLQSTHGGDAASGILPVPNPTTVTAAATTSPSKRKAAADQTVTDAQEQAAPPKKRQRRNAKAKDADGNDIVSAPKPRRSRAKPKNDEEKAALEAEKATKPKRAPRGAKKAAADATAAADAATAAAATTTTTAATIGIENDNGENEGGNTDAGISTTAGTKDALPANNTQHAEGSFAGPGSTAVGSSIVTTVQPSAEGESDDVLLEMADRVHDETHRLVDITAGPNHDEDKGGNGDGIQSQKKQRHRKPLPRGKAMKKASEAISERLATQYGSNYATAAEQEQMALLEASRLKFAGKTGSMTPEPNRAEEGAEEVAEGGEDWDDFNFEDEDFNPDGSVHEES